MKTLKKHYDTFSVPIIFTFLFLFPLGQLLRIEFKLAGKLVPILGIDLVASFSLPYLIVLKKPKISKYFYAFFASCVFSLIFSLNYFNIEKVIVGSFYFFRIIIYYSLFILTWNAVKKNKLFKNNLYVLLTASFLLVAVLGWIQYFYFFDLRFLKYAGWDDHLGRLTGTFLDPSFTGFIMVVAFFTTILGYIKEKRIYYLIISIIFLITLLFTYSRASYLALIAGFAYLYLKKTRLNLKLVIFTFTVFLFAIPFLPRGKGEGVKLERTSSIIARLGNYDKTLEIIKEYPLFGVGFNNICWAKESEFFDITTSHSCFGSDSSLLLVFATTGIVGFALFINMIREIYIKSDNNFCGDLVKIFIITILVHSTFSNSMFYPWIMGIGAIILGISVKENK